MDLALTHYLQTGLFALEQPLYRDYLARAERLSGKSTESIPEPQTLPEGHRPNQAAIVMLDRGFGNYLDQNAHLLFKPQQGTRWKQQKQQFLEQYLKHLPAYALGLVPQAAQARHFITYLFAEAVWLSLLLNLILLGLLAPFIEKCFGRASVLFWFFTAGALHALLYYLSASAAHAVLLGTSGATAGLTGVFLVVLAVKPSIHLPDMRTRCTLGLALLGLYSLKSAICIYFGLSDALVLGAELGVMIMCAALCILLFGSSLAGDQQTQGSDLYGNDDPDYRHRLQEALSEICQFNFDRAKQRIKSLSSDYPAKLGVSKHRYQLEKLDAGSPAYQEAVEQYINLIVTHNDYSAAKSVLKDCVKRAQQNQTITYGILNKLFRFFLAHSDLRKAEHCYRLLEKSACPPHLLTEAVDVLRKEFSKRQLFAKAEQYSTYAQELQNRGFIL